MARDVHERLPVAVAIRYGLRELVGGHDLDRRAFAVMATLLKPAAAPRSVATLGAWVQLPTHRPTAPFGW
jgi:hypothetical protein